MLARLIVAIYGAILSTYNFVSKIREKKRRIKVNFSFGFLTGVSGQLSPDMLLLTAVNTGYRPIILNSVGFILPNNKTAVIPIPLSNVNFPYELKEGKDCLVWTEVKEFAKELKEKGFKGRIKLIAFYKDSLDTIHKSKPLIFDIDS